MGFKTFRVSCLFVFRAFGVDCLWGVMFILLKPFWVELFGLRAFQGRRGYIGHVYFELCCCYVMLCCCPKQLELWSWKHGFVFGCEFNLGVKGTCFESDDFYVLDFEIAVFRLDILDIAVLDSTFFKLAAF